MSLYADAVSVLGAWEPPSTEQAALRAAYLDHLAAHPDGLLRGCLPDHLTASTVVLDSAGERVLLTLHAKAGLWLQFGGHLEPGDATLAGGALREVVEESGIAADLLDLRPVPIGLDVHPVPFCSPGNGVRHLDVTFLATALDGGEHAVSEESLDVAWWPVDDLPNLELASRVEAALAAQSAAVAPS